MLSSIPSAWLSMILALNSAMDFTPKYFNRGLCILHHDLSVTVIAVDQGKAAGRKVVKEQLFGPDVFIKCFVIIEVVMGNIGEDATGKFKTCYPLLGQGMRADFHKGILTACIHHFLQQTVQLHRIRCGMGSPDGFLADIIADGGQTARFITECREKPVKEGHGCGLAIGSGYAHQFQPRGGIVIKVGSHHSQRPGTVLYLHKGDIRPEARPESGRHCFDRQ